MTGPPFPGDIGPHSTATPLRSAPRAWSGMLLAFLHRLPLQLQRSARYRRQMLRVKR